MGERRVFRAWAICMVLAGCSGDPAGPDRQNPEVAGRSHASGQAGTNAPAPLGAGNTATGNAAQAGGAGAPGPVVVGGAKPGTFTPKAALDANAQFDWPETAPGEAKCQPGTYVGMFGCSLPIDPSMPPPDGTPPDFSGPITLEFKKSADGEFLELANAKLDGSANDVLGFTADLNGRLDCTTLEFTSTLSNGVYGLGSPILLPAGDVNGTLSGTLDLQTGQLTGTWSLFSSDAMEFTCDGPWMATFTP